MLTATTQHMLRALVELARMPKDSAILGKELARRANVPPKYLAKILLMLRNAGFIEAIRGQHGGYKLKTPADQIRLIDAVELVEGVKSKPGCLLGEQHECTDELACPAHDYWKEVRKAYIQMLERVTIADLVATHPKPKKKQKPAKKAGCKKKKATKCNR